MRRRFPRPSRDTAALLLIIMVAAILFGLAVTKSVPSGVGYLAGPFAGPLVYLVFLSNRRKDEGISSRPTRPSTSRSTTMPPPRPDHHPLWDHWLDG